jgi:predicted transcriptional regulator
MNALIITSSNKTDLKFFAELAKRTGVKIKSISEEELLDFGLIKAMSEGRESKVISKEKVMSKLKK